MAKFPKPRTVNISRQRRTAEAKVIKAVRAKCIERDGYACRMGNDDFFVKCVWPLELAHLGHWRKCHTKRMKAEERHVTKGCLMLCTKHHRMYDNHEFDLTYGPDGADGPLVIVRAA